MSFLIYSLIYEPHFYKDIRDNIHADMNVYTYIFFFFPQSITSCSITKTLIITVFLCGGRTTIPNYINLRSTETDTTIIRAGVKVGKYLVID